MSWRKDLGARRQLLGLVAVLVLGALTGGCFQPLYRSSPNSVDDSIHDKLAAIDITQIVAPNGTPDERLAVAVRNSLLYDLNGGTNPVAPTYQLDIHLGWFRSTVIVDLASGRPDAQVEGINATFTLTETATNKVVLRSSTFARSSFDVPGSAQRFAEHRATRNAEDRAVEQLADNIRNRLASYFVAGT